jgi:Flp pilus assembly protein TadD
VTRFERHVVAVVHFASQFSDLVADFLPMARRRYGMYIVAVIPETSLKALYFSNRAVELLEAKKFDEALVQAKTAVTIDPKLSVGWNTLGVVERSTGAEAEAEIHFLKALSCDRKDVAAMSNMENLLREKGRTEEAAKYRQLGLEVRKKDPYFHALLAEEALNEGNLDEAESQINEAIRIHFSEPEFYLFKARLSLLKGQLDGASKAIEKARKWAAPGEQERYDNKLEMLKRMKPQP